MENTCESSSSDHQRLSRCLRGQPSPNNEEDAMIKVAPGTMELVRLEKLTKLLLENPYKTRVKSDCGLYGWDDLMSLVQATDKELESALRVLSAVKINGYWRIVEETYMGQMLNSIIWLHSWCLCSLDEKEVVKSLVDHWGYPPVIARHCLELYCSRTYGGGWELDKKLVCLQFARRILAHGKMRMEAFVEEWRTKVPGQLPVSLDMLEGEVMVEKRGIISWVYLPSDRFPGYFKNGPNGIGRIYTLTSVFHQKKKNSAYCRCGAKDRATSAVAMD